MTDESPPTTDALPAPERPYAEAEFSEAVFPGLTQSCDPRQPFRDSMYPHVVPDILTCEERDELCRLQKEYRARQEVNERYAPQKIHAHLDKIRQRMIDDHENAEKHVATLTADRQGFHALRMGAKERVRRFACHECTDFALPVLRRSLPVIQERIDIIDADFQNHWHRCSGQTGEGKQSPVAAGLRGLQREVQERITKLEKVQEERLITTGGGSPYFLQSPLEMVRGLVKWMPQFDDVTEAQQS